jgi:hypothetical protein
VRARRRHHGPAAAQFSGASIPVRRQLICYGGSVPCSLQTLGLSQSASRQSVLSAALEASMSAELSRRSVSNKGDDPEVKPAAPGGGEIKLEAKMSLLNGITVIVGSIIGSGEWCAIIFSG